MADTFDLKRAYIYGLAKGYSDDNEGVDTSCPCCAGTSSFSHIVEGVADELRQLWVGHKGAGAEEIADALGNHFADGLTGPMSENEATTLGFIVGEEIRDWDTILYLQERALD